MKAAIPVLPATSKNISDANKSIMIGTAHHNLYFMRVPKKSFKMLNRMSIICAVFFITPVV